MRKGVLIGILAGVMASTGAWAETAQQNRMKTCNAEAGEKSLAGEARKDFMKTCLSGTAAKTPQQRMKDCNADASSQSLKGEARKDFMKACLSRK